MENRGQLDPTVRYYVTGRDTAVYFQPGGVTFALSDTQGTPSRWALKLGLVGANPNTIPEGNLRAPTVVSHFTGAKPDWRTDLPTYTEVIYEDAWRGIDLAYSGTQSRLKYEFRLAPRADPSVIRLSYRGATELRVTEDGRLVVSTPLRTIMDEAPVAYQRIGGRRIEVPASYTVHGTTIGFMLGDYDRRRPLVIDPVVLVYAGFLGGGGTDQGVGIDVDGGGNAYVSGDTVSPEATFPQVAGPDGTHNGGLDAFVAKVNPAGTGLVYAGYIGGDGDDLGTGITVDDRGNAYVTGETDSLEDTFPVQGGPDTSQNGGVDAFVAKVNSTGTGLVYAGYIGGDGDDVGSDIAVGDDGSAYVTGETDSEATTFPDGGGFGVLAGPDVVNAGAVDAFVAKVSSGGTGLGYAGYIGGSDEDRGFGIDVDGAGNAYVTGETASGAATFPVEAGPDLSHNGSIDAFVAKVNRQGTAFSYAGYIGGAGDDIGHGISADSAGNAYVAGEADGVGFPTVVGPDLTPNGGIDAFVAKVSPQGSGLSYAGYIGGDADDVANGIAVDGSGNAHVTGETASAAATFPEAMGPVLVKGAGVDAFVAQVNAKGTGLSFAGYLGGDGTDVGNDIAVDAAGDAYVIGDTTSNQVTFPESVGPDLLSNGLVDAFVAKVAVDLCDGRSATIKGTPAAEILAGSEGDDVILGLGGDDIIDGNGGHDAVCGGDGADRLIGGDGDDSLDGGAGGDTLRGEAGDDLLNGGDGRDTASYAGFTAVTADLKNETAAAEGFDTLSGIENLIGSYVNDVIRGDGAANRVDGLGGWDRIAGRGKRDTLIGGRGNDRLFGGANRDVLRGGKGRDRLFGGRGRDRLSGHRRGDRLDGGRGRDVCTGGPGPDTARRCEKVRRIP